ncbi:MAG: O-antigen ligase family protein [Ferrovum myxofaciens]|jgi:O-antigen ligase|nr:O-antigen ligase family protein [Ferrovum myxofaciens]QKE41294.1 MAG: O-antigen ligase family protein [Ferrovum myxofaciens]
MINIIKKLPSSSQIVRILTYCMLACLPFSVAGVNFFGFLVFLTSITSREFWKSASSLIKNPIVITALFLFGLMFVGIFHTSGSSQEAFNFLNRYKKLIFIPLLIPHFQQLEHRITAVKVFAWSIFMTVILSWSEYFGLTHMSDPAYVGAPPGDAVFKMHITQGMLFSLLIAISTGLALCSKRMSERLIYLVIACLSVLDIGWVMVARTGKATIPILAIWIILEFLRVANINRKKFYLFLGLSVAGISVITAIFILNPETRMGSIIQEVKQTHHNGSLTSEGERVEFWKKGLILFSTKPILGYGTGSILYESTRLAKQSDTEVGRIPTYNLHNEYLMWAAQLGIFGLAGIVALFYFWFRMSLKENIISGIQIRGHWVVFSTGCLFNPYLIDFTEGYSMVLLIGIFSTLLVKPIK